MKKLLAFLLALCMLLSLNACVKKEEKGITITNNLGWTLEEIYIAAANSDSWGEPMIKQLADGAEGRLFPEQSFGSREITVDILAIDGDGDTYEVYEVLLKDGDTCAMTINDDADFVVTVGDASFIGQWYYEENFEYDITGVWEYDDQDLYLLFDDDGCYVKISNENENAEIIDEGIYSVDGDVVTLSSDDGFTQTLTLESDQMYDSSNDYISYLDSPDSALYDSILDPLNGSADAPQETDQTHTSDESEYWGVYESDDGFLAIYDDGTFEIADSDGDVYNFGTCNYEDGMTLTSEDGEIVFFVLDEDGNLYGGEEVGTLFRIDPNDLPDNFSNDTFDESDFEGYWQYGSGYVLEIVGDTWFLYDDSGKMMQSGPTEYEGAEAWLMNEDGSSGGGYLYFDDEGDLIESGEVLTWLYEFPYGNSENEQSTDILEGDWYYADQWGDYDYPTLYFDGYENYIWDWDDHCYTGTYTFDGDEIILFDDEGGYTLAYYNDDQINMEGDAGSWYCRS